MSHLSFSRRLKAVLLAAAVGFIALTCAFALWASGRIDADALHRQAQSVAIGLDEIAERIPVEQDSVAIWDEAALNLRAGNADWLADNLAEWVSSYFDHDRVYILDPQDNPVRAVAAGEMQPPLFYDRDRQAIAALVAGLRTDMQSASSGLDDSTSAITGMGVLDIVRLSDDMVGIASIRPIVPSDPEAVPQAPGTEYLHVSIKLIDQDVADTIAEHFGISGLHFVMDQTGQSTQASQNVINQAGETLGVMLWTPFRPAAQLLIDTIPVLVPTAAFIILSLVLLLRRLDRTAARLELSEAEALYLAFHDPLARIPNRALFDARLERAIAEHRKSGVKLALHMVDLDRFKTINDTLGHPVGDELIRTVALRLSSIVSEADTVARIGGDEFAIIQVNVTRAEDSLRLGERIIEELARPFDLLGHDVSVSASVGIVCCAELKDDAPDMIRKADIALYEAKASGRNRVEIFAGELDQVVRERRELEIDLRAAINDGTGLELVFQPIFSGKNARILGAEALVRWNHPKKGRMSPDLFIGLAEERGLIDGLGMWVLRTAVAYAKSSAIPWVAINVSPVQFRNNRFAEQVFAVLDELGLPPKRLELEITEGLLLQNSPGVQQTLRHLRAGGIRVALDDFGTGYSSISYLRTYGVDKLKIDKSFVAQLGHDPEVDSIVRSIIELARAMHMSVTAEGVETEDQRALLTALSCDQLQGYLLSRPVPAENLDAILTRLPLAKAG
ncbi:bifunctional diguanylate cyclase/phosphodiesterase [Devosia sp. XK-2]|uniref:putative bifunctional diguanylate cyclase/phosphodiesterase n=1 Tax=Devosia sp. XK-2 TaxID=3126689 RepID=UPI0030CFBCAC